MHAGIELNVDGPSGDTLFAGCLDQGVEQTEGVDFGLQVVIEHGLEGGHLRIHNHDVAGDASLAQGDALVGHGHGQIVDPMFLQGLRNLHGSGSIAVGLDHAHQFGLGPQEGTIVVQVLDHRIEVDLENGLVDFLLQQLCQLVETETARAFQENQFAMQLTEHIAVDELLCAVEEILLGHLYEMLLRRYLAPDANQFAHSLLCNQLRHLPIEHGRLFATLVDVAENECMGRGMAVGQRCLFARVFLAAVHEIEGNGE